jgi:hypothetical protein
MPHAPSYGKVYRLLSQPFFAKREKAGGGRSAEGL